MQGWAELGKWINEHTSPNAVIATDAAGLIPYYSGRVTLDMFGLTDMHIAHLQVPNMGRGTTAHEKFDPDYILAQQPDYIVSTWLDEKGNAISAGLDTVREDMKAHYRLIAVAKIMQGPPNDGKWVQTISKYSSDLYRQGYQTGLFERIPDE
jgi:hypothetical protein